MILNNKILPVWLDEAPDELYPQHEKVDHHAHYIKLKDYLEDKVHSDVTFGASLINKEILLNDHGPNHIKTVISRASYLVDCESCDLGPYEVYLLLCCIQLHDVGNIFGRIGHEKSAVRIMRDAENICGRDTIEAINIKQIAETHGGKAKDGDKDKIRNLKEADNTEYGIFRPRLLASILRFADELADDKNRANHTLLKEGALPKGSEIYHAYAASLHSVSIDHSDKAIRLNYKVKKDWVLEKFGKDDTEEYLINEIYSRVKKMHLERTYCSRFWKGIIDIDRIIGSIEFYDSNIDEILPAISFEIFEKGYPEISQDIFELAPTLVDGEGNKLDGEYFKNKITDL